MGKDHTLFSLIDGLVKFEKYGPDKKKVVVSWLLLVHIKFYLKVWGNRNTRYMFIELLVFYR